MVTISHLRKETDLHTQEHGVGADILIKKLQDRRPRIVCFVGMGIWKTFFSYLTAAKFVPRESTTTSKTSTTKKKGAVYSPEDALMAYKLVHSQHHRHGGAFNTSYATLDNGTTPIKREDSPAVAHDLPTVKVEVDDEQPMRDLDDNKMAPVTETLFFVMPNTSGLVASYKVRRAHSIGLLIHENETLNRLVTTGRRLRQIYGDLKATRP